MKAAGWRFGMGAVLVASVALCLAASASADISFCTLGSGAGQCKEPKGVAADAVNSRVYVADSDNNRVNVFDSSGTFQLAFGWGVADGTTSALQSCGPAATPPTASCFPGIPGTGAGQFANPERIAVDNNAASPNFHDVYVTASARVQRFSPAGALEATIGAGQLNRGNPPISVGPANNIYAVDSTAPGSEVRQVKIFTPAGVLAGSSAIGNQQLGDAVVDSSGDIYVSRIGAGAAIEKYELSEPSATLLASFDAGAETKVLAVDGEDNLYAAQFDGPLRVITKHDPTGTILKRFGYGQIQFNLQGLAVGAGGALYGSEEFVGSQTLGNKVIRIQQPPPGALGCCVTVNSGNTKATLKGQVNPEGKATTYHFEYISDADFIANGNSFAGANPATSTPESAPVGSDFTLHPAEAQIGCLTPTDPPQAECLEPETIYHVRLVVSNEDDEGEDNASEEITFLSQKPLEITDTWASAVGIEAAEVHARVDPLGIPASAFFEYVDDADFQISEFDNAAKAPATPIALGGGVGEVSFGTALSGLLPDTLYHYRVVAADAFAPEELGPERSFHTFPLATAPPPCANDAFRVGLSAALANCRAYEMVSPVDKNGGDIKVLVQGLGYPARLDQSAADGESFTYSSVTAFAEPASAPWSSQYLARRSAGGWSTEAINPPKEPVNLTGNPVLKLDAQYKIFSADLSEGWVFQYANPVLEPCAPEGFINLYRRDNASGSYEALATGKPTNISAGSDYRLEVQGVSTDGTRAVFRANGKLTKDAVGATSYQLYEHVQGEGCGELRLLSYLPNGSASAQEASAGTPLSPAEYRTSTVARAVSADGRRVFFSLGPAITSPGTLYVRINADQEQSLMSAGKCTQAAKGCTLQISAGTARFWSAAADGSRAIYSVGEELFEYDLAKALAGEAASSPIAGGLKGVVGASEDASRLYFVSGEAIEGEGVAGKANLYLFEAGESGPERYRLVATLREEDVEGPPLWGFGVASPQPIRNGIRLTADGAKLAFVSSARLTSYDNADAIDARPNLEVYLYDAGAEAVSCISCNPSGGRPQGREFEDVSLTRRVSGQMAPGESQLFAPRALSADGNRLFFESFESLLPRDVNKGEDVYEWQRAPGASACREKGAGLYVPGAGGCLSLISSGQDEEVDSELADASADGADVFIRTASSLLPQDSGQIDVYDAREGGGFPLPPLPTPPCEGEACPGPAAPAPNDPAPASQGPSAGNVQAKKPCPKGKVRRGGKCRKKLHKHKGAKKKATNKKKGGRR